MVLELFVPKNGLIVLCSIFRRGIKRYSSTSLRRWSYSFHLCPEER